jgi:hypothetical protein
VVEQVGKKYYKKWLFCGRKTTKNIVKNFPKHRKIHFTQELFPDLAIDVSMSLQ